MKLLNGKDLAEFIKERQAHTARALSQSSAIMPRLAIIRTNPDPVVDSYMKLKQSYGQDIGVHVDVHDIPQSAALDTIAMLNADKSVHGIIVQIPLPDVAQTNQVLNAVDRAKDVDGLAASTAFDPATPMAISWLLAGYNVELKGKTIVVVGHGRLVGRPLVAMWRQSGLAVTVVDRQTPLDKLKQTTQSADILVCAAGVPGLVRADMVKPDAVVVDAGVATDSNGLSGDVAEDVRDFPNITITPKQGGVGPLTVCALFENVLRAAQAAGQTTT